MKLERQNRGGSIKDRIAWSMIEDFPEGIDVLITGVGTGGHSTGCAETIKKKFPKVAAS